MRRDLRRQRAAAQAGPQLVVNGAERRAHRRRQHAAHQPVRRLQHVDRDVALAQERRYPSGSYLPAVARGFAAFEGGDYSGAIEALAPIAGQDERIGGSRAQHDLIDFTLLSACLRADRMDEARQLLAARRPGASGIPVLGVAALR